jgi:hypothetical protein
MVVTTAFLNAHIDEWEGRLGGSYTSHRGKWPSRLFHHAPIENAALILRDAALLSRVDSEGRRVRDVAASGVIQLRDRAHRFARLYFRQRTPTQFHIEGIRKPGEILQSGHAPILVMFVFDARKVLTAPGVHYSDSNMQSSYAREGNNDQFFASIDWASVYHEGPFSVSEQPHIIWRRCAEVLTPSPFSIVDNLQWIYCRSQAERTMLLALLGADARKWRDMIRVSDDIRVFEKKFTYVDEVSLQSTGLIFRLAPRTDGRKVKIQIRVWDAKNAQRATFGSDDFSPVPSTSTRWRLQCELPPDLYRVRIELEDCVGFDAPVLHEETPF